MAREDYDKAKMEDYYDLLCKDIIKERKRIGGDWVLAGVAMNQELKNIIRCNNFNIKMTDISDIFRSRIGPDLVFVVLSMDKEDVRERLCTRHMGDKKMVDTLMVGLDLYF